MRCFRSFVRCLFPIASGVILLASVPSVRAATFTVTDTGDSGPGTLRQAIADANAAAGLDTIVFAIPEAQCDAAGVCVITVGPELPAISEGLVIDGTTQPRYGSAPDNVCATRSAPSYMRVLVSGTGDYIFKVEDGPTTIRGLAVAGTSLTDGIRVETYVGTTIQCSHFGIDGSGQGILDLGSAVCVQCYSTDGSAVIGTDGDGVDDIGERNVFGAGIWGVNVNSGDSADPNRISGNYFGLLADGRAQGDLGTGVFLRQSSGGNLIGTDGNGVSDAVEANVFCYCNYGVSMSLWASAVPNVVSGNRFGIDAGSGPAMNGIAIRISDDSAQQIVADNQFLWNWKAIVTASNATLGSQSGGNCISGNTYGLSHEGAVVDLFAEDNYWGSADGPSGVGPGNGDEIAVTGGGSVDFTPWLSSPSVCILVFVDGFENGTTDAWSNAVP